MRLPTPVTSERIVKRIIGDHSAPNELLVKKLAHETLALRPRQFARQRELDFTTNDSVLSTLAPLGAVPERLTIVRPYWRVFGG